MIFFPSTLGKQLLCSLEIDKAHWEFTPSVQRFVNKNQNIYLEYTSRYEDIHHFEMKNVDLRKTLTYMDRKRLIRFVRHYINSVTILNSRDNPEAFI